MRIRPFEPDKDRPRLAEIRSAVSLEPVTAEQIKERQAAAPPDTVKHALVAETDEGLMVGYAAATYAPGFMQPGDFWVDLYVDKPDWGRGVGSALHTQVEEFALSHGGQRLSATIRDDYPSSLTFAEHHGYSMDRHLFASTLDATTFDEYPFAGAIERAEKAGIHFATFADFAGGENAERRLWQLETAAVRDVPGRDAPDMAFADYREHVIEAAWFRPECYLLALDGDKWVGLCGLEYYEKAAGPIIHHNLTGVLPAYRGNGIALALKVLAVRTARALGVRYLRTDNDSQNAPILAINRKMGYVPETGEYIVRKDIGAGGGRGG